VALAPEQGQARALVPEADPAQAKQREEPATQWRPVREREPVAAPAPAREQELELAAVEAVALAPGLEAAICRAELPVARLQFNR